MSKSNGIRILATSDIHGFLDGLDDIVKTFNPHVFVVAGDIHPCYININADEWFMREFFPLVESWAQKSVHVVVVPGNHDFWLHDYLCGFKAKGVLPPNLHLLCDAEETIYGLRFYGTPWVPWINGKWCWEASDKTLEYEFSKIPDGLDVLIAHSPPLVKHAFVDISMEKPKEYWRHFGSKELSHAIKEKRPRYVFCGHIHSGSHTPLDFKDSNGKVFSTIFNVSRVNEKYQVLGAPMRLEIPSRD